MTVENHGELTASSVARHVQLALDAHLTAVDILIQKHISTVVANEMKCLQAQLENNLQGFDGKIDNLSKGQKIFMPILEELRQVVMTTIRSTHKDHSSLHNSDAETSPIPIILTSRPVSNGIHRSHGNDASSQSQNHQGSDSDESGSSAPHRPPDDTPDSLMFQTPRPHSDAGATHSAGVHRSAESAGGISAPDNGSPLARPARRLSSIRIEAASQPGGRRGSTKEELTTMARVISLLKYRGSFLRRHAHEEARPPRRGDDPTHDEYWPAGPPGAGYRRGDALDSRRLLHLVFGISRPNVGLGHAGSRIVHPASPFIAGASARLGSRARPSRAARVAHGARCGQAWARRPIAARSAAAAAAARPAAMELVSAALLVYCMCVVPVQVRRAGRPGRDRSAHKLSRNAD